MPSTSNVSHLNTSNHPPICLPALPTLPALPHVASEVDSSVPSPAIELRSLHLINGEHFSGAERVQQLLGRCLPEFGVDANFVCLKQGKFPELCGLKDEQVTTIGMKSRFDLSIVRRIAKHAQTIQTDVLHAHTPRTAMIAGLVAKRCNIPWVYHVHSPTARDSTRATINRINDWVEAYSLRHANHIITVSKSLRREMLQRGHSRHKITAIANGVAEQLPIDPAARRDQDHWRLGMVALIRPRKGIEILLEAIAAMGPAKSRITLDVVGGFETSQYEKSVRDLIANLQLEQTVHLRGFTRDVPSIMRTFDAMVLPSLFGEGMPMVVLEALACGVPVIATRVEGTPEVVRHKKEGILANPQDADSLAQAIKLFISDRMAWETMSQNAVLRHRDGFSDRNMAERTASVYRKLCIPKTSLL
jgi:glycosyltransferase involved in cell wall biosynthesis